MGSVGNDDVTLPRLFGFCVMDVVVAVSDGTEFIGSLDGHRPEILAFCSMIDRRKRLHREIAERLPAERPDVAQTIIPALSLIEQMAVRRAPVTAFAPRSEAARSYARLWAEVRARAG